MDVFGHAPLFWTERRPFGNDRICRTRRGRHVKHGQESERPPNAAVPVGTLPTRRPRRMCWPWATAE
jgi:hypothetical protein